MIQNRVVIRFKTITLVKDNSYFSIINKSIHGIKIMKKRLLFLFIILVGTIFSQNQNPKRELRGAWIATVVNIDWPLNKENSTEIQKQNLVNG